MLVLTQLSAGAFAVDALGSRFLPEAAASLLGPLHAVVATAIGLAALGASIFHLGRPLYAFRALIGLRTSWMSREILAFGIFAPLAILYAASFWLSSMIAPDVQRALGTAVATVGVLGVACSVLIYHATRRAWWNAPATGFKFFMTAAVLGLATRSSRYPSEPAASTPPSARRSCSSPRASPACSSSRDFSRGRASCSLSAIYATSAPPT